MKLTEDNYGGVIISNISSSQNAKEFKKDVLDLIKSSTNKKLIWIKIPAEQSALIPILTSLDFEFHHCDNNELMLVKKLTEDAIIPTTKNYMVGVGAVVICDGKLLVIRVNGSSDYKLPGGYIDKREYIKDALKREVLEETGVDVEFESIINIGHYLNGQFGESNLYIVCTAKVKSKEISIKDSDEISEAKWMDPIEFANADNVNNYNKAVVKAALNNKELKLTEQDLELVISDYEVFS